MSSSKLSPKQQAYQQRRRERALARQVEFARERHIRIWNESVERKEQILVDGLIADCELFLVTHSS
jgi:hypothetical protein